MAFLGGLFGNIKTKDVMTGIARTVAKDIKEDFDDVKDQVNRLSELRLQRASRDQDRRNTKLAENLEVIKDMEGKLGDIGIAQWLIETKGYTEARKVADELVKKQKLSGGRISPAKYLGIEKGVGGRATATQLAEYVTPSAKIPEVDEMMGPVGMGWAKILAPDYAKGEFKRRSDRQIRAAYGDVLGKTSITDLPEGPKGKDLYEWQIYTEDNAAKQAAMLQTIQTDLLEREQTSTNPTERNALKAERLAAKAEQDIMLAQYQYEQDIMLKGKTKPLKSNELERYGKAIAGQIATHYGMADDSNWVTNTLTGTKQFAYAGMNAAARKEIERGIQPLKSEINKAHLDGVDAAAISDAIFKAVDTNQKFKYVKSPDGVGQGDFEFAGGDENRLVDDTLTDTNGKLLFTGLIQTVSKKPKPAGGGSATTGGASSSTSTGGGSAASSVTASVGSPQAAAAQTIASKKQAYQSGNNAAAKSVIVTTLLQQLNRAGIVNPATNKAYTQAELEAELSK